MLLLKQLLNLATDDILSNLSETLFFRGQMLECLQNPGVEDCLELNFKYVDYHYQLTYPIVHTHIHIATHIHTYKP